MSNHTFFWHDYETFGAVPRQDRPSQFAGIRTDAELNEIGEPVMLYCRQAPDYLPTLQACLLTGITPQLCQQRGVAEHEFAGVIERELATPGTIGVGYNSLRFDDEVTRFLFWRNLIDPYAREWQNHCGRWDLLDLVRATYALRPDGIVWPKHEDGRTSFKLEHLSAANGLAHESAHDALSDVRATIALARLIRDKQPKLFDYYLTLRKKDAVKVQLSLHDPKPVLHISGMYGVERGNLAMVWPLAAHPTNANEVIVWDLTHNPAQLRGLSADVIRQRMFSRGEDLPAGVERLPIKTIHINKSPFVVANLKVLSAERAAHWSLDLDAVARHAETARALPELSSLWRSVYQREAGAPQDVDENLYGGFVSNNDRKALQKMRRLSALQLAGEMGLFEDPQLAELLFRYRARNFPTTLSGEEQNRWRQWCRARLERSAPAFQDELSALQAADLPSVQQQLLQQVADYAASLQASLA
ncbi:exodeoxyribonuclease I [Chromobacterium sphagni]|uniref:Exodeoxyribonuclease I n=1 Tax=Chromobacterium sphagni TaxID=1903179 RepID=A0A1S1X413_9NEIS|nr:exodeoxyribonuclease I [Chromobacterium sphagni]OHX14219.1 exodeoxyribonuclease I [Chromobacterium sphagni]OHX20465.1 exodeoxyribonuclease I [Chromobacterium sphagni]